LEGERAEEKRYRLRTVQFLKRKMEKETRILDPHTLGSFLEVFFVRQGRLAKGLAEDLERKKTKKPPGRRVGGGGRKSSQNACKKKWGHLVRK